MHSEFGNFTAELPILFSLTKIYKTYINRCSSFVLLIYIFRGGIYNMNKTELVSAMSEKSGLSKKDAESALKAFTEVVSEELVAGGKVQLVGFGTFEVAERAAREGRNPQSGEVMKIAASKAPKFKAGKALKDMVNK